MYNLEPIGEIFVQVCTTTPCALRGCAIVLDACRNELGIDVDNISFVANLTRTSLEYYDGFIFTSSIKAFPSFPPVAQGGRYNALTSILGNGANIPAVGGIIRPELLSVIKEDG